MLCSAQSVLAATKPAQGFYWTGLSDIESEFNNTQCWYYYNGNKEVGTVGKPNQAFEDYGSSKTYKGFFRSDYDAVKNMTVTFGGVRKMYGGLSLFTGTSTEPVVFIAKDAAYGLTSTAELNIGTDLDGCLQINSGTYQFGGRVSINNGILRVSANGKIICKDWAAAGYKDNYTGTLEIDGGEVLHDKKNYLTIADTANSTGYVYIKNGGKYSNEGEGYNGNGVGLCVGERGEGTLVVDGGTVDLGAKTLMLCDLNNGKAILNIKNGSIVRVGGFNYGTGTGGAVVTVDGGVLEATGNNIPFIPNKDKLNVYIGAKGATVDTGAFDISIPIAINNAIDQEGSLKFTGGGSVALNGALNYTGKTTIDLQTALSAVEKNIEFSGPLAFEDSSKLKISRNDPKVVTATSMELPKGGKVVVDFIVSELKPGSYNLLTQTGDGVFLDTDADKFEPGENAPICKFSISEDKKSVVLTLENIPLGVWTGKGDGVTFSDTANWSENKLPTQADDVKIDVSKSTELVCDIPLNVNSITFAEKCALVTIVGDGCITNATAIVNNSEARHVVNVPVEFYAEKTYKTIDVTGEVDFKGGVKGTVPVNHTIFYGKYTLTASSWKLSSNIKLAANATLTATAMDMNTAGKLLDADAGAVLTIGQIHPKSGSSIFGAYAGKVVTDKIYPEGPGTFSLGSGFTGELRVKWIYYYGENNSTHFTVAPGDSSTMIIGGGNGITCKKGYIDIGGQTFKSSGDWSFDSIDNGNNNSGKVTIGSGITVDTSDVDDPTAPGYTVTVKQSASYYNYVLTGNGGVSVIGNGSFVFTKTAQFTGGLTASDRVTIGIDSGVYPGKGNVTIKDTATLKLAQSSSGTVPVAGTLTMEGGSTINIPSYSADIVPLSVNGLAFANVTDEKKVVVNIDGGALRYGFNAILKSNEGIPADAWDNINLQLAESVVVPEGVTMVKFVQGKMLYILLKGDNGVIWTGSGNDANFSNAANWMGGSVPANGSSLLIATADAATLVNDISGFAPASITFSGISSITIDGENAIEGVTAITNLSAKTHTINVPVKFTGPIAVAQPAVGYASLSSAHIVFAGGAYAAEGCTIASIDDGYSWAMFGKYFFANGGEDDAPYVAKDTSIARPALGDASELHVPKAGEIKELYVGKASLLNIGKSSLVAATDNAPRLSYINGGEVVVGELFVSGTGGIHDGYATFEKSSPESNIVKIEKAVCLREDGWTFYFAAGSVASKGTYYFGKGGLSFGEINNGFFGIGMNADGDEQTIRPWYSDFTIASGVGNDKSGYDIYMYRSVVFNTNDEKGIGRTITLDARPRFRYSPSFKVSGSGKVLVNSMASNKEHPTITVADSATLAYKPGASLGTGLTTVNGGAALEVAMSGKVALKGNLTLKDGAVLGFNFTGMSETPVLKLDDGKTLVADGSIKVRISAPEGKRPSGGRHYLTAGTSLADDASVSKVDGSPDWVIGVGVEEGKIYADIKPAGTRIIVR